MAVVKPAKDAYTYLVENSSDQATLVIAETSPNHGFLRVRSRQFPDVIRETAAQTVFLGMDVSSEEQVCWHRLRLSTFPLDVRRRVWEQLRVLESLPTPCLPAVLASWQVPRKGEIVLITRFSASQSLAQIARNQNCSFDSVQCWIRALLDLVSKCSSARLSPLLLSLDNVRVNDRGALVVEDLLHLPSPKDERYEREFLLPSASCDTAALGHFTLSLREVLPSDSPAHSLLGDFSKTCFRHLHDDRVLDLLKGILRPPLCLSILVDWEGMYQTIDFSFNEVSDSPKAIAQEFIKEFGLDPSALLPIARVIESKAKAAGWSCSSPLDEDLITLSPDFRPRMQPLLQAEAKMRLGLTCNPERFE